MPEFFDETFYGNTVTQWALALIAIVVAILAGKALYWFFKNVARKLTQKTKTNVDYLLVDMIEEPLSFALVIAGIWYAVHHILTMSAGVSSFIDQAYYILIIFNVAWFIVRIIDSFVQEYLKPLVDKSENDLDDQLLPIASKGTKLAVWALAFIVALDNAGYDVGALVAGLGIGGLAFALAAQDTISNLFGGFTIFVDKPFRINDRIQVSGFDGTVIEVGIRSTRIRTLDGRLVTIPNKNIVNDAPTNVSSEPSRKVVMKLGLTYDMGPEQMQQGMDILKQIGATHKTRNMIEDTVLVSFNEFGDFSLNLLFIYYIKKEANILDTFTSINMEILKQFNAAGLDFAFPSQTVYTPDVKAKLDADK